jgi:maltose O-acetyltransferase
MPSEYELMLANEMYSPADEHLLSMRQTARRLMYRLNQSDPDNQSERRSVLLELLGKIGINSEIEPPFYCDYGSLIFLGENVFINFNCVFLDCNRITVGDNCMFAPGVQILTAYHPLEIVPRNSGRELAAPVMIGNNVWFGGGVIVCPGVTIGDGAVIGAGSIVTRDIPANSLALGNPARVIRQIDNSEARE